MATSEEAEEPQWKEQQLAWARPSIASLSSSAAPPGSVQGGHREGWGPVPGRSPEAARREGPLHSRHLPWAQGRPPGSRLWRLGSPRRGCIVRDGCRALRCPEGRALQRPEQVPSGISGGQRPEARRRRGRRAPSAGARDGSVHAPLPLLGAPRPGSTAIFMRRPPGMSVSTLPPS